ncbi:T-complex 10 C-terminal domain-containing protein [Streptomyces sp. SID5643]|uniref:T-complex 10 C-terminal domain-containing protein n=1 Tax=Streptomyces sp. SID5643 TaxID=2690307 RepID=UPI00136D1812|nr:T-complex 10 C-terminal domain-containing protein [Streptomyces sp. SID5643]MZF88088.1 hypothetical protein [Streptomyces sp. SID5643]
MHGWRDAGAAVVHAVGADASGHHADLAVNGGLEGDGGPETSGGRTTNGDPYARGSGTRVRVAGSGGVEIRFPDGTRERVPR